MKLDVPRLRLIQPLGIPFGHDFLQRLDNGDFKSLEELLRDDDILAHWRLAIGIRFLPKQTSVVLAVSRAIEQATWLRPVCDVWSKWAREWLSNEDRTEVSARWAVLMAKSPEQKLHRVPEDIRKRRAAAAQSAVEYAWALHVPGIGEAWERTARWAAQSYGMATVPCPSYVTEGVFQHNTKRVWYAELERICADLAECARTSPDGPTWIQVPIGTWPDGKTRYGSRMLSPEVLRG